MFHISVDDNNIRPIKIIESEVYTSGIPASEAIKQVGAFGQNNNDDDDE